MPKIKLLDNLTHNGKEFDRDAVIDTDEVDISARQLADLFSVKAVALHEADAGTPKKPAKDKAVKKAETGVGDIGMNALIEGAPVDGTAPADKAE